MGVGLFAESLEKLIQELEKLPGVGPKTAQRLAFYILKSNSEEAKNLTTAITEAKAKIGYCKSCNNFAEQELCGVCSDLKRDSSVICVVHNPIDVIAIEKTYSYNGVYYVLMGALSPLDGIGPDELKITNLISRLKSNNVKEVILATNAGVEGEATALYLSKLIKPLNIKTSRIASGLPAGADIEYADSVTLVRALEGRHLV
ncbi:MAG: recombination mediator RecR [Candidatus Firestonebacteria bacterium]